MNTRRLVAILIAFILTIGATAMWSAATDEREGDADANAIEDSGSLAGDETESGEVPKKKKGNKVARIFAAPFKAFGKLFNRKDDNKFQRMSEKDSEGFNSVAVARVDDSRSVASPKLAAAASAKDHLAAGRSHLLSGRINEAISDLSTAVSLDPKLSEAHNLLGVAYDKKGFGDHARTAYERAVKAEPEDAQTLNNLGFSLYQNGNYRAAVDRLKRAVKLAPTDERILNNLGLALCRLGKFDDAYKNFARAAGPLTGNLNTARMLERFGRDDDAIKYYESARRIDAGNTQALRRLADLYKRTGKPEQSEIANNTLAAVSSATAANSGR